METLHRSKSGKAFEAVSRLRLQGVDPTTIIKSSAWSTLMQRIDKSIEERSQVVEGLKERFSRKRSHSETEIRDAKRARTETVEEQLARRKKEAMNKATALQAEVGTSSTAEEYEAYRRECWRQYYEWLSTQKPIDKPAVESIPVSTSPLNALADEDIMKELLG